MTGIIAALAGASAGLGGTVATPDLSPNQSNPGGIAVASLTLTSAGAYSATNDLSGNYCTPTSLAGQLDARLTLNIGTSPTGASMSTWLNLGTTRTWSLSALPGQVRFSDCTLEIRESASGVIRDTSLVTFNAEGV